VSVRAAKPRGISETNSTTFNLQERRKYNQRFFAAKYAATQNDIARPDIVQRSGFSMPTPKPLGQITRGKTAPNRLRQTDSFLRVAYPLLIRNMTGVYVDLGYGAHPVTTLETFNRLRKLNPRLRLIGVEIDKERVEEAQPFTRDGLEFRFGGFNLPLNDHESVSVIRAFNVLRQYSEREVDDALKVLSTPMTEHGLLIEGTCDPTGRLLNFNLHQKQNGALKRIAFVLAPRLSSLNAGFTPKSFQAVLPKSYIHHAEPGGAIDRFFKHWHAAWQKVRSADPRQTFIESAYRLSDHYGYEVDRRLMLLRRGFLLIRDFEKGVMGG